MARATELTTVLVRSAAWLADRVVGLELVSEDGVALPAWAPGAHIDVILPSGAVRQYSLSGSAVDPATYEIAVLLEASGRGGSREIHQTALVGRKLSIKGPRNHFPLVEADEYLFVAGGIGITPILSMVRKAAADGIPWTLLYGGRDRRSMAYLDEVQKIPGGTVAIVPQDEGGLLDLEHAVARCSRDALIYCCGPEGLLRALAQVTDAHGRTSSLHLERFGAGPPPEDRVPAVNGSFEVELAVSGIKLVVPPDRSVLDVVTEVAPTVLSSCSEGYCGTCETRVIEGVPDHRDTLLSEADKATNETMMICVSRSLGPRLVLDL